MYLLQGRLMEEVGRQKGRQLRLVTEECLLQERLLEVVLVPTGLQARVPLLTPLP